MADSQFYSKEMPEKNVSPLEEQPIELAPLDEIKKGRWERSWPTIACGAGLFSDGYLNAVRPIPFLRMQVRCYSVRHAICSLRIILFIRIVANVLGIR